MRVTARGGAFAQGKSKDLEVQFRIQADGAVSKVTAVGTLADERAPARLFMNRDGKFVEEGDKRGVNQRLVSGVSVVAGDFNNDMYDDLFIVASGEIGKQENLLLLNDGTGHFKVVKGAGGAAGNLGGVGDTVTTADFDGDGRLDLLIANGGSMGRGQGLPSDYGAGYRLYRNVADQRQPLDRDRPARHAVEPRRHRRHRARHCRRRDADAHAGRVASMGAGRTTHACTSGSRSTSRSTRSPCTGRAGRCRNCRRSRQTGYCELRSLAPDRVAMP